jgi:dTDP-glucose 4,6-dehydratase
MRILVTGGLGFIGSNFVRYMADKAEIIVADALKYGSNENNFKDLDYIRFVYIALGSLSELEKIETDILWLSITNLTKVVRIVRNDS